MKVINIGGKDYTFTYSVYASLHAECIEKVTTFMAKLGETQNKKDIYEFLKGIADIPGTAMHMFYAGLLEYHGTYGSKSDRSVLEFDTAINLMRTYFEEHKTDGKGNFYEILMELMGVMGDDGFFEQIGLENVFAQITNTTKKEPKKPQDHKKPTRKTTKITQDAGEK